MRIARVALVSLFIVVEACVPRPVNVQMPPPPASGARVRLMDPGTTAFSVEITPGADARVIVGFGDRIADLDVTPATENQKLADALVAFAPVSANHTVRIDVRARPWTGADVLQSLVEPLGGPDAAKDLLARAPAFPKRKLIEVALDIASGDLKQSTVKRLVLAPAETLARTTRIGDPDVVARETPIVLEQWEMTGAGDGYVPVIELHGSALVARTEDAQEVPVSALPAAVWTLWFQLE